MPSQPDYNINPDAAFAGQIAGNQSMIRSATRFNAEGSASIPFAYAVKYGTTEKDALLPSAATSKLQGITMFSHAEEQGGPYSQLDAALAVKIGERLSVMVEGEIWAICQDGCNPGDRLHVRWQTGTDALIGSLRSTADSTHTIDCTNNGEWLSVATAGTLAKLRVNFTVAPGVPTAGN